MAAPGVAVTWLPVPGSAFRHAGAATHACEAVVPPRGGPYDDVQAEGTVGSAGVHGGSVLSTARSFPGAWAPRRRQTAAGELTSTLVGAPIGDRKAERVEPQIASRVTLTIASFGCAMGRDVLLLEPHPLVWP